MATIGIKVRLEDLPQITSQLNNFAVANNNQYVALAAIVDDVRVTVYNSGAIVFAGKEAEHVLAPFKELAMSDKEQFIYKAQKKGADRLPGQDLPANFDNMSVIGSDETGAGSAFGPLVTVATYVPADKVAWAESLGIRDSKKLNDDFICHVAPILMENLEYSSMVLNPTDYNKLRDTRHLTVDGMKVISHNSALLSVAQKVNFENDAFLVDEFCDQNEYFATLNKQDVQGRVHGGSLYFSFKGESFHVAVAAASIIARFIELQQHAILSAEAGVFLPVGSGHNVDEILADLIAQGQDISKFTKMHFGNVNKARALLA